MKNLTPHQQQLVDEMIAEFSRINPKPSVDGKKRFSVASIDECNQEKNRFLQTMAAHNRAFLENAMLTIFVQFLEFEKEFGEVVSIHVGNRYGRHTFDSMNDSLLECLNHSSTPSYAEIRIVPKGKPKDYDEDGKVAKLYAGIKSSQVSTTLISGEKVYSSKYESIWWGPEYYPSHSPVGWEKTRESLDELLQSDEKLQQAIVKISNIK